MVGPETDDEVIAKLNETLGDLGYSIGNKTSVMAGSQEIVTWTARGPHGDLTIESETYVGISLTGSAELIDEVRSQFEGRAANASRFGPA
jgi:hypothetical protein